MSSAVENNLLELWRNRSNGEAVTKCCETLIEVAPRELDKVELYLPQFAHMIITLPSSVANIAAIERYILSACQISIHVVSTALHCQPALPASTWLLRHDAARRCSHTQCRPRVALAQALQFFWMVFSSLQENRPKRGGDRATYVRCARLLLQLEQCVVYGVPSTPNTKLESKASMADVMKECAAVADAVVGATIGGEPSSVSAADSQVGGVSISGTLKKKGGGLSRFGRRNWNQRYCEVRDRVFYYYHQPDGESTSATRTPDAPIGKPKGSMALNTAIVTAPTDSQYQHYFVLTCKQTGLVFHLQAASAADMKKWIHKLTALSTLPAPPGLPDRGQSDLLESVSEKLKDDETPRDGQGSQKLKLLMDEQYAMLSPVMKSKGGADAMMHARRVYEYFNSQREFTRAMTNVAESLRSLAPAARQAALHPHLEQLQLPPRSYFPLSHSDEKCCSLLRFTPGESIVFNTKARCPLMLICETRREAFTVGEIALQLSSTAAAGGSAREASVSATLGPIALESPDFYPPVEGAPAAPTMVEKKKEPWNKKEERLRASSPLASVDDWELRSFIVKSNDDLRQEVFIMQMIKYFRSIWPASCWLNFYHILATGPDTGLIETIIASADLDALKKRDGYTTLRNLFVQRHGPPGSDGFLAAQSNFVQSLAAYSVVMWILLLRDRHNGNLMLTETGHFFHIDFGFCLGHSTGKQIGGLVECSPFKLTPEYLEVLDGVGSPVYERYCQACIEAMVLAHDHAATICTMVEIVGTGSRFPCFQQTHVRHVIPRLKKRLFMDLSRDAVPGAFRKVIDHAAGHWGSRYYDWFQNLQRGIAI